MDCFGSNIFMLPLKSLEELDIINFPSKALFLGAGEMAQHLSCYLLLYQGPSTYSAAHNCL